MPERDPDVLLERFAELTERVQRPALPGQRSGVARRVLALAGLSAVLVSAGAIAVVYGPRLAPSAGGERMELPTHRDLGGGPAALTSGRLVRDGDCVYVESFSTGSRELIVWPHGTTLIRTGDEQVIVDGAGRRVAALGEPIEVGGGEIPLAHMQTLLETGIPEECSGPYWFATAASSALEEPRAASWQLMPMVPVNAYSTTLSLMVTEAGCHYGLRAGSTVVAPQVEFSSDAVVVTVDVRSNAGMPCPGDHNSFEGVRLAEPLAERRLIDGSDGSVEWQPQPGLVALRHERNSSAECYPTYLEGAYLAGSPNDPAVAWVTSASGRRVDVLWPEGFAARFNPDVELIGPIGQVIARAGDELTLAGGFLTSGEFEACGGVLVGPIDIPGDPMPWASPNPAATSPIPVATHRPTVTADLVGRPVHPNLPGCGLLVESEPGGLLSYGELWEVDWPAGYIVSGSDAPRLIGPDGSEVAKEGDVIEVAGSVNSDGLSVCVVGAAFDATAILSAEPAPTASP